MSKPELIFHIGSPKTGTSALQDSLSRNRDYLLSQGVYVGEDAYQQGWYLHFSIYNEFIKDKDIVLSKSQMMRNRYISKNIDIYTNQLLNEFGRSGCSKFILTNELFFITKLIIDSTILTKSKVDKRLANNDYNRYFQLKLKEIFADFDIKIVCYLRRQDLFIESFFNQNIKLMDKYSGVFHKLLGDSDDGKSAFHRFSNGHIALEYFEIISDWVEVFAKKNVILRPYEKCQLKKGTIHDFYSNIIGFTVDQINSLKIYENANDRMHRDILEFKIKSKILKNTLLAEISNELNYKEDSTIFLTDEERQELLDYYSEGNRRIAIDFLGRQDGVLFYEKIEKMKCYEGLTAEKEIAICKMLLTKSKALPISVLDFLFHQAELNRSAEKILHMTRKLVLKRLSESEEKLELEVLFEFAERYHKSIIIYGVRGMMAERVFKVANKFQKVDICVVDRSIKSIHCYVLGELYVVYRYEELVHLSPDIILIAADCSGPDIYEGLRKLGLKDTIILPVYDFSCDVWNEYWL